jgi:hypothetical protein
MTSSAFLLSLALVCPVEEQASAAVEPGDGPDRPGGRPPWPGVAVLALSDAFESQVTGAPFSATLEFEFEQHLADGNRIVRAGSGRLARDARGRVRREQELPAIGPWPAAGRPPRTIIISDPVESVVYLLDPERRVAHRLPERRGGRSIDRASGRFQAAGETARESLGQCTIEGVTAEGTRTVHTIPAATVGSERPIEIVSERWYSPELKTVVRSVHSDPRLGETRFRLTAVERTDPDPALFRVPPDYAIGDPGDRPGRHAGRRPPPRASALRK